MASLKMRGAYRELERKGKRACHSSGKSMDTLEPQLRPRLEADIFGIEVECLATETQLAR